MILVTGGTGFVGRHLVDALLARGEAVRVLSRNASALPARRGLDMAAGDLADPVSIEHATRGVERVVHLAARIGRHGDEQEALYDFNVKSAAAIAAAAGRGGVRHFVHVSSGGVYGDGDDATPHSERAVPRPGSAYERSKLAGEQAVTSALTGSGARLTILRPAGIYGPGRPATAAFLEQVRRSRIWVHSNPNVIVHPTHVSDVVQACLLVLDSRSLSESVINVAGEQALPFQDFIALTASTLGIHVRQFVLPGPLARPLARSIHAVLRTARIRAPEMVMRAGRRHLNRALDTQLARRLLGFTPLRLDLGLRQTADALRTSASR